MSRCIFCDIIERNDSNIIYQNKDLIVLPDINPKAYIHLLVISKKHIENLKYVKNTDKNMLGEMLLVMPKISKLYNTYDSFKIEINNGKQAKQEIYHMHFHFLGYKKGEKDGVQ